MLLMSKTKILGSFERAASAADLTSVFEGAALRLTLNTSSGLGEVSRSTSATTEFFAGVAMNPARFPVAGSRLEQITVPSASPYQIVLQGLAVSTSDIGVIRADGTIYVQADPAVVNVSYKIETITVGGNSFTRLTFAAGDASAVFSVTYRAVLSGSQAASLIGDQYARLSPDYTGTISVITHGEVYTDAFDPTCAWTTPAVKMTAGGMFSHTSSARTGTVLTNALVIQIPTVDNPYLGVVLT